MKGKPRSPMGDAVREFQRNKLAVGSLIFILIVGILALFAPVVTPDGFNVQNTA